MVYEKMLNEKKRLESQIQALRSQISMCPEGKLICSSNGKGQKWYRSDGHISTYLPKKERRIAEQLAYKKYLSLQLKNALHEKEAIDFYLRHHDSDAYQVEQSFINSPKYKDLLAPSFTPLSSELQNWINESYERNNRYPENLIHKAHSGNLVRSKSEAMIDMFLFKNKIPFRYECLLQLGEMIVYPDFTIRHPKSGRIFYWEHFGMMDVLDYNKNVGSKLQLYISNGIIPSIHLITTYETKDNPLSSETVEKLVEDYFCS